MPDRTTRRSQLLNLAGSHQTDERRGIRVAVRNEVVGEQTTDDSTSPSSVDVYVFDEIGAGWWGVSADDFVRDVAGLDVDHIDLHLNSPGGDAFEGVAIANVLRQHRATITVWIDGLAASAASVIAMAGDEIVMGIGAQLMIHDAWTYTLGNADELRQDAARLDGLSDSIATTYAARAGGTAAEWRAVMQAETWYGGEEAVTAGLADRVATDADRGSAGGEQIVPGSGGSSLWDWWDSVRSADRHADVVRARYAYAGRDAAPDPQMPGRPAGNRSPAAPAGGSNRTRERSRAVAFSDEQLTTMRQQLGLAEDADEATIVAGLTEALEERAEEPSNSTTTPPAGTAVIDEGVLNQLRADAAAGREARQQQQAEHRERLVSAAIRDGRTTAAARNDWLNKLAVEGETAEQQLASLAPGLVPVTERGHDQAGAAESPEQPVSLQAVRESAAYKNWSM